MVPQDVLIISRKICYVYENISHTLLLLFSLRNSLIKLRFRLDSLLHPMMHCPPTHTPTLRSLARPFTVSFLHAQLELDHD